MPLSRRTPSANSDHHQVCVTWGNEEELSASHRKGSIQGRKGDLKEKKLGKYLNINLTN